MVCLRNMCENTLHKGDSIFTTTTTTTTTTTNNNNNNLFTCWLSSMNNYKVSTNVKYKKQKCKGTNNKMTDFKIQ
jgi:hypothetical protein